MKKRLDVLVSEKLGISRSKAQRYIMAGRVFVNDRPATKSGQEFNSDDVVEVSESYPYVSRGAEKLKEAADKFKIDFNNKVVCDVGASTGGFTDFVLQNGAKRVYAIDVGYGQLDSKLRNDDRVINMERTNIRDIKELPEKIDIFVCDVSFISLKKVLPKFKEIEKENFEAVVLVKPQFEVGKKVADKYKGVIKDEKIRKEALKDIKKFAVEIGYKIKGAVASPIKGAKGNKEFLLYLVSA